MHRSRLILVSQGQTETLEVMHRLDMDVMNGVKQKWVYGLCNDRDDTSMKRNAIHF